MKKLILTICIVPSFLIAKNSVQKDKKIERKPQQVEFFTAKCNSQLASTLEKLGSQNKWIKQAPTETGNTVFRSPTAQFGHWLEVVIKADGQPSVFSIQKDTVTVFEYENLCTEKSKVAQGMNFSQRTTDKRKSTWFDDSDLKKIITKSQKGLIYVWSPEMVYSAKYYKYFRDAAKKLKIDFKSVLDPRCQMNDVEKAISDFGVDATDVKLNSVELYMRNLTVHYPTTLVYGYGQLSDMPIVGVMEKDDIEAAVQRELIDIASRIN